MHSNELIGALIGLPVGWRIRNVDVSPQQRRVSIHVERAPKSLLAKWTLRSRQTEEHRWQTLPIAGYKCYLHVHVDVPQGGRFTPEPWMGEIGRPLTYNCVQHVRSLGTAIRTGDERTTFDQAFGVSLTDVRRHDIMQSAVAPRTGAQAPASAPVVSPTRAVVAQNQVAADPRLVPEAYNRAWRALALGEVAIDIKSLPLKLLLTRIRMQVKQDPGMLDSASAELQRFFLDRSRVLGHELAQVINVARRSP